MTRKVCVAVTARPSYSRIRSALHAISAHPELELQLVVAASALLDRYGNASKVIERDGFEIDRRVYMIMEGENLITSAKSVGFGLSEMATAFDNLRPDIVVTVADRFETMATAVAASYMHIPLAHVQGGEITGSIDEKVRHAVTKLADYHLVSSDQAATRVVRMGEEKERVFVTGCPSIDIALESDRSPVDLHELVVAHGGVGSPLDMTGPYIVVIQHPVTTEYAQARRHVEETLHAILECGIPTLWFWPNVDAGSDGTSRGIRAFRERFDLPHVHFFKNLPPEIFLHVLNGSCGIVGNSSVAIRECEALGIPAVNIGNRQAGRDRGANVQDVGYDRTEIAAAVRNLVPRRRVPSQGIYGDGEAGPRIADVLARVPLVSEKRLTY
ncbi:MAG: UDP-N-acetylglucosamine 2-epimerase [Myxococcota bacterium]|nr:UDP-N-acetylglucosamine 2-epimerase [Myxococcota bacterium]